MASFDEKEELKKRLDELSCPFTWNLIDAVDWYILNASKKKTILYDEDEEAYLPLEKLMSLLVRLYTKVIRESKIDACAQMEDCENFFRDMQQTEPEARAVKNIFIASKCHFLYNTDQIEDLKIVLNDIINICEFNDIEESALYGCESIAWGMYMEFGARKAAAYATRAIAKNSENGLWHFVLAKSMRQIRRAISHFSMPCDEEKKHFKIAYDKCANPVTGIYMTQMLSESTRKMKADKAFDQQILTLCQEILNVAKDNYKVLLKLALRYIRIKSSDQSRLARLCLDTVQQLAPDNSTYLHYEGVYHERFGDSQVALEYLKKAADCYNFAAELHYIRFGQLKRVLDPLACYKAMLDKYSYLPEKRQQLLLCVATCYYDNRDMKNAGEYYLQAVLVDPSSEKLKQSCIYAKNLDTRQYKNGIYGFLRYKFLVDLKQHSNRDKSLLDISSHIRQLYATYGNCFGDRTTQPTG